ncbi:MAG: rhodanese-like domain-containing protein [Actinomycetes bacterium]
MSIHDLQSAMQRGDLVVDVRERFEFVDGHVPGVQHIPMATVPVRLDELPPDRPVYVICESGGRSWQVAAFLARHGLTAYNVEGGTAAWRASGLPLDKGVTA